MILKLLSYNIRFGGLGREDALIKAIKYVAPDLVVFQEAIHPGVIERISSATGLPYWAARKDHSIGYVSRNEIAYHEWHYPAGARHSFLEIVPAGTETRIFGLHLSARFSKWDERRRAREIRSLLEGIKRHQNGFHLLVGDFNTLAPGEALEIKRLPRWIRALIWVSGRELQRETIQLMLDAGYVDGYRLLNQDTKGYTFPTWDPHVRLDYAFLPKAFSERLIECNVITEPESVIRAASDHCPLVVELRTDRDGD
ncbi:MAG TPA: endonuclease/exonuclease/phosphatase family protein [Pyrinomonadaceae bacterium]|nr:endonuclease/exonuclease/phosphatase family protein [Pyrinomonadaceae bacterium]